MRGWGALAGAALSWLVASEAVAVQACYTKRGEEAIAACTQDIETLPTPRERAVAYNNRGSAYRSTGQSDLAIADFDQAIDLDPDYAHAYYNRGNAYGDDKGDAAHAIADFSEAIRLNSNLVAAYFSRARAYLYSGDAAHALADIDRAAGLSPRNAYNALWLDIIGQRNNAPSRLSQSVPNIDMTAWPAPVVELFLGRMTQADMMAAAENAEADKKQSQLCEAHFYSGELALRKSYSRDEAIRELRLAATGCPADFTEALAAKAELKALGITP